MSRNCAARVAIALILSLSCSAGRCPSMKAALKAYGYEACQPPSRLMMPGTLIWESDRNPLVAGVLCSADKVMGPDWVPAESPTINQDITKAVRRGINFAVDLKGLAKGNANVEHIEDMTVSIKDAKILEITDVDVAERANKLDDRCLRAMERRQRANFKISMVQSALLANSVYHVKWANNSNLNVQAKVAQLEQLSASLGIGASTVTDKTISAENLVIGVRVDDWLAYLYSPDHVAQADRRKSMISSDFDVYFLDKEDASSTTSHGEMPTLADSSVEDAYWSEIELSDDGSR